MWAVTNQQQTGNTRYCETKDEIRIPPTQLLASSLDPPLDFSVLQAPLPVTGCPGKMSFQRCVSFIACRAEFPGEVYHLETE